MDTCPTCKPQEPLNTEKIKEPIEKAPSKQVFKISGMDCAEEVAILKREVGPLVGGEEELQFDLLNVVSIHLIGFSPVRLVDDFCFKDSPDQLQIC